MRATCLPDKGKELEIQRSAATIITTSSLTTTTTRVRKLVRLHQEKSNMCVARSWKTTKR